MHDGEDVPVRLYVSSPKLLDWFDDIWYQDTTVKTVQRIYFSVYT
jgi:hypothetical protein